MDLLKGIIPLLVLAMTSSVASSGAFGSEMSVQPERCVRLSRIKSLEVISKRQIVFEMMGGRYYVNSLPYACPGMRRDSTIMYRTSLDALCSVDVITVLEEIGGALQPGASCGLGKFEPMEKAEIVQLREAARQ